MKTTKKAVAFMRSANQHQDRQHNSIVNQYETIQRYADRYNIKIQAVFDNEVDTPKKPLHEVLDYCKESPDIKYLIVKDVSRISRNFTEFCYLKNLFQQNGVEILTVDGSHNHKDAPVVQFMENLQVMFGQFENSRRSEMVKQAMARRAEEGYSVQRPPLGYYRTHTRGLYKPDNTASALACYCKDTLNGKMSVTDLQKAISRIYHPNKLIRKSRLKRLLTNPYYSGYISYGDKRFKGLHQPLFTETEQQALVELLNN